MSRWTFLWLALLGSSGCLKCGGDDPPTMPSSFVLEPEVSVALVGEPVTLLSTASWQDVGSGGVVFSPTASSDVVADVTGVFGRTGNTGSANESHTYLCVRAGTAEIFISLDTADGELLQIEIAEIACGAPEVDQQGDLFYSDSSFPATFVAGYIDIRASTALDIGVSPEVAEQPSESIDPNHPLLDFMEVRSDDAEPIDDERLVALTTVLDADVPWVDPDHTLTYAAIFDSDRRPDNNWRVQGDYDFDQYQGGDLFFEATHDHRMGAWEVNATQILDDQSRISVPTSAVFRVRENRVSWLIPRMEFPGEELRYRVTTFGHDGSFSPSDSGGDVDGDTPLVEFKIVPRF